MGFDDSSGAGYAVTLHAAIFHLSAFCFGGTMKGWQPGKLSSADDTGGNYLLDGFWHVCLLVKSGEFGGYRDQSE